MIKADHLIKTFVRNEKKNRKMEINAVDDISLTVEEGEIVGILGPNGAGKTTLLRMMSRLMKPTSGQVSIRMGETEMTDEIEVKRHIGYLSNNTKLYGRLSSRELLQMLGTIYGIPEQTVEERIRQISEVLSMDAFLDNRIEALDGTDAAGVHRQMSGARPAGLYLRRADAGTGYHQQRVYH